MATATFRFYEELNDFLPVNRRRKDFAATFNDRPSVKDMLAAFGVSHEKIDLILANGISIAFDYTLKDGDRFSVYPVFERLNIEHITRLRSAPLRHTKFIADKSTTGIANYMKPLGFDIYCDPALSARELIELSNREKRIILTKNKMLLAVKDVTRAILIRPGTTARQVKDIINRLDLNEQAKTEFKCDVLKKGGHHVDSSID